MQTGNLLFEIITFIGSVSVIYLAISFINGLRDSLKLGRYAFYVKDIISRRGNSQMIRLGLLSMLFEGDTMRSACAIMGFTNGKFISQPESVVAMLSSYVTKILWVLVAVVVTYLSSRYDLLWIPFLAVGLLFVLMNLSRRVAVIGKFSLYFGLLLLGLMLSRNCAVEFLSGIDINGLWQYTLSADILGIVLCGFIGITVGIFLSGNLTAVFLVLILLSNGVLGVECAISFVVGTELGALFPMSFTISGTNLPARKSFGILAIIFLVVFILDLLYLAFIPMGFFSDAGVFGLLLGYLLCVCLMLPLVYYLIGARIWSRLGNSSYEELSSKKHLYRFNLEYCPHVALMLIQAEKEIVNLQYRIHKMLGYIINIIDGEDVEVSLEKVRKYRVVVYRTSVEITDFIISQTSAKNNSYISELVKERLKADSLQRILGGLFCDIAEAVNSLGPENHEIIRRCIVSLETLLNQATKLIESHFSADIKSGDILVEDVDNLSLQLSELISEYGANVHTDVLPYCLLNSRKIIVDIIESLK